MNNENPTERNHDRRSFLKRSSLFGLALLPAAGLLASARSARADANLGNDTALNTGDINVLQFLRVAELVEADLWGQYAELAIGNPGFRTALQNIDPALPDYVVGDHNDEQSHANLIAGFLLNAGVTPVDISGFYTLPPLPNITGVDQSKMHLTSLLGLTIDTSWYNRYRGVSNPDFSGTFAQIVNINNRPTVPYKRGLPPDEFDILAQTAAFHFGAIEQGGSSLYLSLLPKVTNRDVVALLGAIGPTEFYHFALFQTALEGIRGISKNGLTFPTLRKFTAAATPGNIPNSYQTLTPNPCTFIDPSLPLCSVIRPSNTANAGAVATVTSLAESGLFNGQPDAFFVAATGLAMNADAATNGGV